MAQINRPITGLLLDLKLRGLLEDVLVILSGEFDRVNTGQTVKAETGRAHHPERLALWLSAEGIEQRHRVEVTDDYRYYAVEDRMRILRLARDTPAFAADGSRKADNGP